MANLTVIAFIAKPTDATCYLSMYGFTLSVAVIYAPMLVKTNRIYRIFEAGRSGTKQLRFINSRTMVIFMSALVMGQVQLLALSFTNNSNNSNMK